MVYKGSFHNNEFCDPAATFVDAQETYVGGFERGLKNGEGKTKGFDGTTFVGGWKNGKREGQGVLKSGDQVVYAGNFKQGEFSGLGASLIGREKYEGGFASGQRSGFGKLTVEGGRSTECDWRRGEMCDGRPLS